jgi:hypothetical protein
LDPQRDIAPHPGGAARAAHESEHARKLRLGLQQFLVTMKNLALYPETSQTNRQGLAQTQEWLAGYMKEYGPLALFVEKDGLFTQDAERVYQEKASDPIIAFPLFRDGVQSIIFEPGVSEEELKAFMSIILRFRTITEQDQDDVVTAMWEAALPSIKYTIADEYEAADPEFDVGAMVAAKPPDQNRTDPDAPWQATSPVETDGSAPVAKPMASLFALAESLEFVDAGTQPDPHSERDDQGDPDWEDEGFAPFGGDGDIGEDDGFGPLNAHGGEGDPGSGYDGDGLGGIGRSRKPMAGKGGTGGRAGKGNGSGGGAMGHGDGTGAGAGDATAVESQDDDDEGGIGQGGTGGGGWADDALGLDLSGLSLDDYGETTEIQAKVTISEEEENLAAGRKQRLKFWGMSAREIKQISAFIQWEDTRAKNHSVLEVVMTVIKSPVLKASARPYLVPFILEEILANAKTLQLAHANAFLAELREFAGKSGKKAVKDILADVRKKLDDPALTQALAEAVPSDQELEPCYESVRYFLYQMPPQVAVTLAENVGQAKSLLLKRLFLEVVAYDVSSFPVEQPQRVLHPLNEWATLELITMFRAIRHPMPIPVLMGLVRHQSAQTREAVARLVLDHEPENTQLLATLAIDPSYRIRQLVTPALTAKRDPLVENMLLERLSELCKQKKVPEGEERLLDLYQALGRSASGRSLGFLSETLLRKDLKTLFERGGDAHRVGAAVALNLMPKNIGAEEPLAKAARSAFRNIRFASQEAKRILKL